MSIIEAKAALAAAVEKFMEEAKAAAPLLGDHEKKTLLDLLGGVRRRGESPGANISFLGAAGGRTPSADEVSAIIKQGIARGCKSRKEISGYLKEKGVRVSRGAYQQAMRDLAGAGEIVRHGERGGIRWSLAPGGER